MTPTVNDHPITTARRRRLPRTGTPVRDLLGPVRRRILAGTVLAFASSASGLLPFIAVAEIARRLLAAGPVTTSEVWSWVAAGAAGAAGRLGLLAAASFVTHYADADLQRHLRARLARHLATVPLGWFGGRGSGELKKAMDDDVEDLHHLVAHAMLDLASAIATPLVAVVYLSLVDWRMTLVTLAVLPAAAITLRSAHRTLPARMAELLDGQRRINNATIEYVDGIQVVKVYGREGRTYQRFTAAVDEFCGALARWTAEAGRAMFASAAILSPATVLLVILGTGAGFIAAGWLAPLDLLPFLLVGAGLPAPYLTLVQGTQLLRKATLAARHLTGVLAEPTLAGPVAPRVPDAHDLCFDQVRFSYDGEREVLQGVSLHCPKGTVTAIVGRSGSGKTTLIRLVPRFFDPTSGQIRIGGVDVREIPPERLLRLVAVVFQDVVLVRDTARENIRLGDPDASDAAVERAARAAGIHDVIAALPDGYDTVLTGRGGHLSGGERQRLTIARAILQDAPIVLLDEATAYVDPENETAVQAALAALVAGRTLVVVAHRLHTIIGADQIAVLDGGHVIERGTHTQLVAAGGQYAGLWAAQQRDEEATPR